MTKKLYIIVFYADFMFIINYPITTFITIIFVLILATPFFFIKIIRWLDTDQSVSEVSETNFCEEEIPDGQEIFEKAIRGKLTEAEYENFRTRAALQKKKSAQIKLPKTEKDQRFKPPKGW